MNNRINVSVPRQYKRKDFMDVIEQLQKESNLHVAGSIIAMRCVDKTTTFERFGKKFEMNLSVLLGEADITIKEVKKRF